MTNNGKRTSKFNVNPRVMWMAQTGLLMAVELMMWLLRLGQVPVGALNMSFLTVPVAVGAITLGTASGAMLGLTFGLTSLIDAIQGASALTGFFFAYNPLLTVLLCVGTRVLMGTCAGLIADTLLRRTKAHPVKVYLSALAAPLLNTLFFMGFICLFLYETEKVQSLVAALNAANPFMFVVLLVGVQGLVEAGVCTLVAGSVALGLRSAGFGRK